MSFDEFKSKCKEYCTGNYLKYIDSEKTLVADKIPKSVK